MGKRVQRIEAFNFHSKFAWLLIVTRVCNLFLPCDGSCLNNSFFRSIRDILLNEMFNLCSERATVNELLIFLSTYRGFRSNEY